MTDAALPRPVPDPPVTNPSAGKISVIISGRLKISSSDKRVEITRKD